MSKSLCIIPFINLSPRPNGYPKVCSDGMHMYVPKDINFNKDTVETFWNSDFMKQLRLDMIEGKTIAHCEWCDNVDKNKGSSKRTHINNRFLKNYHDRVIEAKENNGVLSRGPVTWEFRLSSVCNSACLTCSPTNSTLIEKQFKKHKTNLPIYDQESLENLKKTGSNSNLINELWKHINNIERIELHGGEPFYDKQTIKLLKEITEKDHGKHITLLVHSNMTKITDEIVDILQKFNSVIFMASIDGFDKDNNHIRWPLKWNTIVKNINLIDKNLRDNSERYIAGTMSVYNCLSLHKVYEWKIDNFPDWEIDWHPAYLPRRFGVNMISLDKRKEEADKLIQYKDRLTPYSRKVLDKVINSLLLDKEPSNAEIIGFVEYCVAMDRIRNQDSIKQFPHLQEVFDKYESITNGHTK